MQNAVFDIPSVCLFFQIATVEIVHLSIPIRVYIDCFLRNIMQEKYFLVHQFAF